MIGKKTIGLFILLVFIVPASAYLFLSWYEKNEKRLPRYLQVADFSFTDQEGQIYTDDNWNNKIVVANYFFTHCPVICPKMTRNIQDVAKAFRWDQEIIFSSFTVDPERDGPTELKQFALKYQLDENSWTLLTGIKKDLYRFARNGLKLVATDGDGGDGDFIHSEKLVLIDRDHWIRGYYTGTDPRSVNQLIKDIKRLKNEK